MNPSEADRGFSDGVRRLSPKDGAGLAKDSTYWPAHRRGREFRDAQEREGGTTVEAERQKPDERRRAS